MRIARFAWRLRTHRLYLRQERLRREADQQLSLAASEDQRPRQQVLGGAHSVRAQYAQLAHGRGVDGGGSGGEGGGFSERRRPFRWVENYWKLIFQVTGEAMELLSLRAAVSEI